MDYATPEVTDAAKEADVKLKDDILGQLTPVSQIELSDAKRTEIERWLDDVIGAETRERDERNKERRAKWRKTLGGERSGPPIRSGYSNISVPLTMWAAAGVRARMRTGTADSDPVISAQPLNSVAPDGIDLNAVAKDLVKFFTAEFRNPRGLNGKATVNAASDDTTNYGMAGMTVVIEPDKVVKTVPYGAPYSRELKPYVVPGRVRWEYIRPDDLVYCYGYGTDTQAMPLVGHQYTNTWGYIQTMKATGWFDAKAVGRVSSFYIDATASESSAKFRRHNLALVYFDYCVEDEGTRYDGIPTALMGYWHMDAKVLLGLLPSYAPRGQRPVWITNFDPDPDPLCPDGQGVCAKLESAQDETDLVHNLGIEAAKRAIAHIKVLQAGSAAAEEFGGGDPILPGDEIVTEDPETNIKILALGDPRGVEVAQFQEQATRQIVTRILGLDESAVGNVESGKRVPASLGLEIKKDSRVIVANGLASFGHVLTEMTYYTLELMGLRLPMDSLVASVGPESARVLRDMVFTGNETHLRSSYIINFNALDAAQTEEQKKQALLTIGQYLFAFYDKLISYGQLAAQMPTPELQRALLMVMEKMENSVRALVNVVDEIPNADEVIPKVAEYASAIQAATPQMPMMGGGMPPGGAR